MGRRSGFEGFVRAAVRASASAERDRQRAIKSQLMQAKQRERQHSLLQAQQERDERAEQKLEKEQYLKERQDEVDDLNSELQDQIKGLESILIHTLTHDDRINFDSLRIKTHFDEFNPPLDILPGKAPPIEEVVKPTGIRKLLPGATGRYQLALEKAKNDYKYALNLFTQSELEKREKLLKLKEDYAQRKAKHDNEIARKNADVDTFQECYFSKETSSIIAYNEMVLMRSEYPEEGFSQRFKVAYNTDSMELVVEYDLPEISVIPNNVEFRYVKSKDVIEAKSRKPSEIKKLYQEIIASITLRTLHEVFEADQANAIAVATFNGIVETIDPATGKETRVPVISARVGKSDFIELQLDKVDKAICLRNLGAQVSSRPDELQAIKPIVEFNMIDKRFIDQGDALSGLESRPNLMSLSPNEFEILVANLFTKMGLDTKLTRSSRDGGVDAVAFDTRPVLGGKVVIQAKRYRDTVGVSAVRDLYGTMLNEGANKGILVCTSGYGPDAFNFSKDKPIELIDGGGLLYLLREHTGKDARIVI